MFPPFWNMSPVTNLMLRQFQGELDRMHQRFDATFLALLHVGETDYARTPADVVYSEDSVRLLHYRPTVAQAAAVPLLLVPSPMSPYRHLDVMPGKSLVAYLVAQGLDVYLIDWGADGPKDRYVTLDTYINGYLRRVVQQVQSHSQQPRISLLGYSMGGTLTAIGAALFGDTIQNLVQIAAPIDFHNASLLSQWTRKDRFNVDMVVDTLGVMPVSLMEASFRMLAPTAQIMQQLVLAEQFNDLDMMQDLVAVHAWIMDSRRFLGEAYRKFMKECYQENHLVQRKLVIDRQRVDLRRITSALLTVTATKDCFCPPRSATVLNELVSSTDQQQLELPGSHVGLMIGRSAVEQLWPQLAAWLLARSVGQPTQNVAAAVVEPLAESAMAGVAEEVPAVVVAAPVLASDLPAEEPPALEPNSTVEAPPAKPKKATTRSSTPRKKRAQPKEVAE